jgi:hypothetical protein
MQSPLRPSPLTLPPVCEDESSIAMGLGHQSLRPETATLTTAASPDAAQIQQQVQHQQARMRQMLQMQQQQQQQLLHMQMQQKHLPQYMQQQQHQMQQQVQQQMQVQQQQQMQQMQQQLQMQMQQIQQRQQPQQLPQPQRLQPQPQQQQSVLISVPSAASDATNVGATVDKLCNFLLTKLSLMDDVDDEMHIAREFASCVDDRSADTELIGRQFQKAATMFRSSLPFKSAGASRPLLDKTQRKVDVLELATWIMKAWCRYTAIQANDPATPSGWLLGLLPVLMPVMRSAGGWSTAKDAFSSTPKTLHRVLIASTLDPHDKRTEVENLLNMKEGAQQQGAGAESTKLGQLIEIYRQNRRNTLRAVGDALFGALK